MARIWQSLRFEVNEELQQLNEGLFKACDSLHPGGRLTVISYESLMDRMVKRFFRGDEPDFRKDRHPRRLETVYLKSVCGGLLRPGNMEVMENPRARSARLRTAEKTNC
jgi:16S rRNA (cytosine1402-N4)-methyltransferase